VKILAIASQPVTRMADGAVNDMANGAPNGVHKKKLDVVIVGGSLGGLTVGLALKHLGHNITILERTPTPLLHDQGAGIFAGGDTLEVFKRYDRCKRPLAVTSRELQYFNKNGDAVHRIVKDQAMTSWDVCYHIMRANFDGIKSGYCDEIPEPLPTDGKAVHLHDHKVTSFNEEGDGVRVYFEQGDGTKGSLFANLLVGADGASSTIRGILVPEVKRTYVGYVALRGTVLETEATDLAREAFQEKSALFHAPGIQILAYTMPGANGSVKPGDRLLNWVYYINVPEPELTELLTDIDGVRHHVTIPPGKLDPKLWEKQKAIARETLCPQFADLVCGTKKPFVQAIMDVISPDHEFLNGKVVLIGDALAGFRAHTAASTSQGMFQDGSTLRYQNRLC
jgi:2-polyprenyl-6-methoxyphenol hydroxylase-like FAD-dependent oxidoreductase